MNDDTNLIDISMLQQLQDQFCCADHLYLMCVDKNKGVVTKPFGTEEQVGFLRTQVDKHAYMELLVYKASAGSGKTFTLAVEYIKLLILNPRAYRCIKMF